MNPLLAQFILALSLIPAFANAENWPQAAGPNFDFTIEADAPVKWSAARDENIVWRTVLPETGQSPVTVHGEYLFFSTMKPVEEDAEVGIDTVAWCAKAKTGEVLWKRDISGHSATKLSACFGDASAPGPVTDGETVVFVTSNGTIRSFDFTGNEVWTQKVLSVSRTQPFLLGDNFVFTRQVYEPDEKGHFTHENSKLPLEGWTQLQARSLATGEVAWTSTCGVNMGNIHLLQKLSDGREVLVVGRGGGHGPPEKPEGVSMISAEDGSTIWTLELPGFMSTQTYPVYQDQALIFHGTEHLWVDLDGIIAKRVSITEQVPIRNFDGSDRTATLPGGKRCITQGSNLRVGPYHFFRAYSANLIGRVDLRSGNVRYLQVPMQVRGEDQLVDWDWAPEPKPKKFKPANAIGEVRFVPNAMRNSRGFFVSGDKRSEKNGWGHTASPTMTAAGDHLYLPVLSGLVYVLKWSQKAFDETALIAINDLGELGDAYTRAPVTFADGRVYAHTIREVLCIGEKK